MILQIKVGGLNQPFNDPKSDFALALRPANEPCASAPTAPRTSQYPNWGEYFNAVYSYLMKTVPNWGNSKVIYMSPDEFDGSNDTVDASRGAKMQGLINVYLDENYFSDFCSSDVLAVCEYGNSTASIPYEFSYLKSDVIPGTPANPKFPGSQNIYDSVTDKITTEPDYVVKPGGTLPGSYAVSLNGIDLSGRAMVVTVRETWLVDSGGKEITFVEPNKVLGYADGEDGNIVRFIGANGVILFVEANDIKYAS